VYKFQQQLACEQAPEGASRRVFAQRLLLQEPVRRLKNNQPSLPKKCVPPTSEFIKKNSGSACIFGFLLNLVHALLVSNYRMFYSSFVTLLLPLETDVITQLSLNQATPLNEVAFRGCPFTATIYISLRKR